MEYHRGRLFDHVHLVSRDLAASKKFYTATLKVLEIEIAGESDEFVFFDEFFISGTKLGEANLEPTGRQHFAFQTGNREMVDAWYKAGLAAGGKDNGAPGERNQYHRGYYAAFLIDPDGNNVEAVHHGPCRRSADSVVISW